MCLNIVLYRVVSCFVLRSTNAHAEDLQRQVVACIFLLFAVFKLKTKKKNLFKFYTVKNVGVWLNERKNKINLHNKYTSKFAISLNS